MQRFLIVVVLILGWSAGCQPMDAPEGYIRDTTEHPYDFKAVSAKGNVIACNVRSNQDKGNLKYWSEAIEHQKVDLDGMRLAGREEIRSTRGVDGVLFNFETGEGQGKISYLLAVYVTDWKIYTVEATGPAEQIKKDMDNLRAAMRTVRG